MKKFLLSVSLTVVFISHAIYQNMASKDNFVLPTSQNSISLIVPEVKTQNPAIEGRLALQSISSQSARSSQSVNVPAANSNGSLGSPVSSGLVSNNPSTASQNSNPVLNPDPSPVQGTQQQTSQTPTFQSDPPQQITPQQSSQPSPTPIEQIPEPAPEPAPVPSAPPSNTGMYKDGQYTGVVADALYGNIQVQAVISGGKLSDVIFLDYPKDRSNSVRINTQAMPYLKLEAIQAQSANVQIVSGATATSEAFIQSLGSALAQAA